MTPADRLERLDEGATAGPWEVDGSMMFPMLLGPPRPNRPIVAEMAQFAGYESECPTNALLIATLRNALPELVAVVRAAEDEQKAVQPLYRMRDALAALDARLAETEKGKDLGAEPGGSAVVEEGQHDG